MTTPHPEWERENTLTTPADRDPTKTFRGDQSSPALTEEQVNMAIKALDNTSFVDKFPKIERRYADPVIQLQQIGLISWVPAKGAKPNEQGVYGFAKLRGNFGTELEASEKAESLIRNVDSYHQIYHTYVGRPFPLTNNPNYVSDTTEVDIRKGTTESISNNIKNKKDEEQRITDEIKDREEMLLKDTTKKEADDPYELYTTLRVKKAQISWTYLETKKKLDEMKDIIIKTRGEIDDLDAKSDDYKKTYYEKYMEARRQSGLSDKQHEDNFIKFMVEDADLGF